jgi:hypothetical protein
MGRRVWKWTTSFRLTCESSDRRTGSPHAQEGRQRAREAGRSCPSRPWKGKADSEGAPRSFTSAMPLASMIDGQTACTTQPVCLLTAFSAESGHVTGSAIV